MRATCKNWRSKQKKKMPASITGFKTFIAVSFIYCSLLFGKVVVVTCAKMKNKTKNKFANRLYVLIEWVWCVCCVWWRHCTICVCIVCCVSRHTHEISPVDETGREVKERRGELCGVSDQKFKWNYFGEALCSSLLPVPVHNAHTHTDCNWTKIALLALIAIHWHDRHIKMPGQYVCSENNFWQLTQTRTNSRFRRSKSYDSILFPLIVCLVAHNSYVRIA